ncbi:hypothetical protein NCAS_0C05770 [Naumovozyma castellii]|uniref:Nitrogen permease regulator 3 n=1 Tax=Naumovozyma castellii TaxID=27288 RepID=G0VDK5_NAUCA|nr:hypothetical protein NCAS_0C05770 [Naumovozyma castellii CBS 4309]CCC69567.1 hypothetical protein NCAS_0C05770 [Naumovozyma castellii CBS 4309]
MNEHLSPNTRLLGVHLTISTHSGPQLIFHYPPTTAEFVHLMNDSKLKGKRKSTTASNSTLSFKKERTKFVDEEGDEIGLSDSELSTDYADDSMSSDFESITVPLTESPATDTNISSINDITQTMSADELLGMLHKKTDTNSSIDFENSVLMDSEDEVNDELNSDMETLSLEDIAINENYFLEQNFQGLNKIFGFDSDFVAEFCSPEREMCNNKFEFTVDEFAFLGLPVHVDSNGKWRRQRHKRHNATTKSVKSKKSSSGGSLTSRQKRRQKSTSLSNTNTIDEGYETGDEKTDHMRARMSDVEQSEMDDINDLDKNMNMFHVCFIMDPPLTEYNKRVDDMYQYIVAKLSLLLRYLQAKSSYVSQQCTMILRERERVLKYSNKYKSIKEENLKAKYYYQRILSKSSLARSLIECVDKLQQNEIACLELGDDKIISLQIPIQNEFNILPNFKTSPIAENCYLTSILNNKFLENLSMRRTAWKMDDVDNENNTAKGQHMEQPETSTMGNSYMGNSRIINQFAQNDFDSTENENDDILDYALLLLDDPTNILQTLDKFSHQDVIGNLILRHLVKRIQPTIPIRSYHYIIDEILDLDSDNNEQTTIENSMQYNILRSCSLHLIYWRHARVIIPLSSKNSYILSPISPIVYSVDKFKEDELTFRDRFSSLPSLPILLSSISKNSEQNKMFFNNVIPSKEHKPIYLGALAWLIKHGYMTQLLTFIYIRVDKRIKMMVDEDLEREGFRRKNVSNSQKKKKNTKDGIDNTVAVIGKNEESGLVDINSGTDDDEEGEEDDEEIHFEYDDPELQKDYTVILNPERATALEKRWIFKCISDQPSEIQILFNRLFKYFNGRIPMELVTSKENIARHDLKKLLNVMDKYLIEIDHW